ncbi:MAG: glycoside hydrolase family 3 C-terminal domain-containing protein [Bacteroidota bacterium]
MLIFFRFSLLFGFLALLLGSACDTPSSPETEEPTVDLAAKIDSLLAKMTLAEKVQMIHASSSFTSGGVERLGIPELIMSDGPHGVRHEHGRDWTKDENVRDSSTYLPVGTALAATWNPALGYRFGQVLGSEARYRGKDVILGPGFNIIRSPLNGRNFEYLTEDPYLNSRMVVGYIQGVQEYDVAACAKHYIANTLEYEREQVDVRMDDRTLREIYLPAFEAAVKEGEALTIMAAYNKFRGTYCAHSAYLLDTILKKELGFSGAVISDWNAVKSTMESVPVGIDIEMGTDLTMFETGFDYGAFHMGDTVVTLVENGTFTEAMIDQKVRRILRVLFEIGKMDGERVEGQYNVAAHQQTARDIADEAIVLLKNDGLLPLSTDGVQRVAVVGANANHQHAGAGGSSQVKAFYEVTPLAGLQNLLGDGVEIDYSPGYEIGRQKTATPAMIRAAVKSVSNADVAIYVGGWFHGYSDEWNDNAYDAESVDKPSMHLPFGQDQLIQAVLAANPNTIIVMMGGGPIDMTAWEPQTKALVQAWYPGMEGGNALADILFGKVNPSGKLPMTFPVRLADAPTQVLAQYPDENLIIDHTEGVFVGYRYYDTYEVAPAFAFGHGLSYTDFAYDNLSVSKEKDVVTVRLQVTNTGEVAGAEVVQCYVRDAEAKVKRPVQELKAFEKIALAAGATAEVTIELGPDAFSYYDQGWMLEPGQFTIAVGSSSRDIRLTEELTWE